MSDKRLQIKLLSRSGELLNVVSCYAGQVSVFRATSPSELMPYHRALAGIPGPERFSISIDDVSYSPEEHILIGFGEHFSAADGQGTLRDFLMSSGIPESVVQGLLVSYGLEGKSEESCLRLTPHEERVARILAATYSSGKVVVINDPFEPITSQWRERLAEILVAFARTKREIVIVPSLSYRPDSWIDNEFIARIQVGENVQKTIGFGSAATDVNAILSRVREEYQSGSMNRPAAGIGGAGMLGGGLASTDFADASPSPQAPNMNIAAQAVTGSTPKAIGIGILGIGVTVAVVLGVSLGGKIIDSEPSVSDSNQVARVTDAEGSQSTPGDATAQQSSPSIDAAVAQPLNSSPNANAEASTVNIEVVESKNPASIEPPAKVIESKYVLDLYPVSIKRSVLDAFEGVYSEEAKAVRDGELRAPRVSAEQSKGNKAANTKKTGKNNSAADLLSMLQSASGTGEGLPDQIRAPDSSSIQQSEMANLSPEQRREMIRQKFLEAIQRAADQRK